MNLVSPKQWRVMRLAVVLVATAACGSSTEPSGRLSGTWDLTLINGQTLPRVYLFYGFGASKQLLGGTLQFTSRSRLEESRDWRNTPAAGGIAEDFEYNTSASFSGNEERIIIQRPGLPGSAAAYADTGLFNGDVLILPVRTVDGTAVQLNTLT